MTSDESVQELTGYLALLPPDNGDTTESFAAGIIEVLVRSDHDLDAEDKRIILFYAKAVIEPKRLSGFEKQKLPQAMMALADAKREKWRPTEKPAKKEPKQGAIETYIAKVNGDSVVPKGDAYEQQGNSASVYSHAEQLALDKNTSGDIHLVQNAWPCEKCLAYFKIRVDVKGRKITIHVTHDKGSYSLSNNLKVGTTGQMIINNNAVSYANLVVPK